MAASTCRPRPRQSADDGDRASVAYGRPRSKSGWRVIDASKATPRFSGCGRPSGAFTEEIAPAAFSASLAGSDILAMVDHDPTKVLARTKSRTLRLAEDSRGLQFDLDVPDTTYGRDILSLVERNDVGGCSFGFTVAAGGERWAGDHRILSKIDLREISVVSAWPAYPQTTIDARSKVTPGVGFRLELARRYLETLR